MTTVRPFTPRVYVTMSVTVHADIIIDQSVAWASASPLYTAAATADMARLPYKH